MSNKTDRQQQLLEIIESRGILPSRVLASMLGVSEMTIHRDLKEMRCRHAEERQSGVSGAKTEYSLLQAFEFANAQKERIGRFAASLIKNGDTVCIDTGSTTAKLLPFLSARNISVLCYNANVLTDLMHKPSVNLLFAGGTYHPKTEMFESSEAIHFIRRTGIDKAFISVAGVDRDFGLTCANAYEVPTKTAVMQSAREVILLADSSKFGKVDASFFSDIENADRIVSDSNLSPEWQAYIASKGIRLHLV